MSLKNPRLNIVLDPELYTILAKVAKRDGISLSLKARDLIREALEQNEDIYWTKETEQREKTFNKKIVLSHKKVWS